MYSEPIQHYENFPVASILSPKKFRRQIALVYHFARGADDLADEGDASTAQRLADLAAWGTQLRLAVEKTPDPAGPKPALFLPLGKMIRENALPVSLFEDLLDAFSQDCVKECYANYDEALDYCRRSANPVGRILLHLYGQATPENLRQSDAICSALQLINFWQDVAVDLEKPRIYLPQDDLARFEVGQADLRAATLNPAFRALMRFQVERARALMLEGAPLAFRLPGRIGWELRLVVQGGLRILEKIEAVNYDVFNRRPVLGKFDWVVLLWRAALKRVP